MAILISCPGCGQAFQTRDENAGREAECPDCGRALVVPQHVGTAYDLSAASARLGGFTSGKALASFALGLTSFGCLFLAGVPAVVYGYLATREINQSQGRVRGRVLAAFGIFFGILGTTVVSPLLIYPAVKSAMEAARRSACVNNYKQVALALHNFHSGHGRFPPAAIRDKQGRPLLSWRVAILPSLGPEGEALYRRFNLQEPWDGPTNAALLSQIPEVFACPEEPRLAGGLTRCQVFVGSTGIFTGGKRGVAINEITDGTVSTILVVEMGNPIPWTAPDDPAFDPALPLGGMGSPHPGGAHMATADGAVRFVNTSVPASVIGALISRAGGEIVSAP
ncbi:MAG: DUF1559 domain-containing protein [Isosphaeraceae bacterium]